MIEIDAIFSVDVNVKLNIDEVGIVCTKSIQ